MSSSADLEVDSFILLEQVPPASVDMEDVMESAEGSLFVDVLLAKTFLF